MVFHHPQLYGDITDIHRLLFFNLFFKQTPVCIADFAAGQLSPGKYICCTQSSCSSARRAPQQLLLAATRAAQAQWQRPSAAKKLVN